MNSAALSCGARNSAIAVAKSAIFLTEGPCSGGRGGCKITGDTPAITRRSTITLWRSARRRRGSGRTEIKIHRRRSFRALSCLEERPRRKTKHSRDQICRETAYRGIVILHRGIEVPAFDRDPVFGPFELRLQTQKTLVGPQFRIALNYHQQ